MKVPQPFPYQGSKRNLAPKILSCIPTDCETFWEPFAGSAAMTIAMAVGKLARRHVVNDINEPLARLWRNIIGDPQGLADRYEKIWRDQLGREMDFFKEVREKFNKTHREDYLLFLLARCVKAAVRYNSRGEFNQGADPRRRGMAPSTMRGNLLATSSLLRGKTTVCSIDYAMLCVEATPQDVIYMDPPYQGVCNERDSRYLSALRHESFVEALREMNERELSYIVSYDGRTGDKTYGEPLPEDLHLELIELEAGRSSQATLLGRREVTFESLYLSPHVVRRLKGATAAEAFELLLV
jgi:DNA adenine methylase